MSAVSLKGLSHDAQAARSWPFEQARALLARVLRVRLTDAERDFAASLIAEGKADEAVAALPALQRAVILETGYGPSGLPHVGTFQEVARTTMVRSAFRALTDDAIPTRLISFSRRHGRPAQSRAGPAQSSHAGGGYGQAADGGARPFRHARELRRPQQRAAPGVPGRVRV